MRTTFVGTAGQRRETRRTFEVSATPAGAGTALTATSSSTVLRVVEQDRPTSGLSILFPDLPAASAPGSTRAWNLDAPPTDPIIASVRLDGWLTIRGVRAATLSMDGVQRPEGHLVQMTGGPETANPAVAAGAATLQGSYVMLASGRLLHATIARSSVMGALSAVHPGASPSEKQLTTTHLENIEARLVGACDGPTEPSFDAL